VGRPSGAIIITVLSIVAASAELATTVVAFPPHRSSPDSAISSEARGVWKVGLPDVVVMLSDTVRNGEKDVIFSWSGRVKW
jgi:hypothetical protein